MYKVTYHAPEVGGGAFAIPPAVHGERFSTLDEARAAIREELGGRTFGTLSTLTEDGAIEAWRDSDDEGCGGFAINEVK